MILIYVASDLECEALLPFLPGNAEVVVGGVGKVATTFAMLHALRTHRPRLVVGVGISGYYGGRLRVGDVALVTRDYWIDEGVQTPEGFLHLSSLGFGDPFVESSFTFPDLPFGGGYRVLPCPGATVSSCSGTLSLARERYHSFPDGITESMELGAMGYVCNAHGIPWFGLRGISNLLEDRDLRRWDMTNALRHAGEYCKILWAKLPEA